MATKQQQINLGTESVKTLLFKLGVPIMLGMLFTALDNLGDAFFISGLGVSQLSAILVCAPIGQVVVALGLLFGNGAGAYIPRLLGAKKMKEANKVVATAVYGSLFLGLIATLVIFIYLKNILMILGATEQNLPFAFAYARIYVPSLMLNIFTVTMNSINSSEGQAKLVFAVNSLTAVLNFALNPLCIYTFKLGIAGAAYATIIAQGIAVIILLVNILLKKSIFSYKPTHISLHKAILMPIFKIGLSTLVFQFLTSLSIALINTQARKYGDSFIAAMGAVTRITSLGTLMVFGFIKGFQPIAGFNYGAKQYIRLREAIKTASIWSTGFCLIFGLLLILFPAPIIAMFSQNDSSMLQTGQQSLRIAGFSFIPFGFCTVYSSLFLALGKVKQGFLLGICRQGICFIPLILILPKLLGSVGIIYAQPIADLLATCITLYMAISINRKLLTNQPNSLEAT